MAKAVADQLVGRVAELGTLDRAVAGLEDGKPDASVLVGEPGIGKTRLLAELSARADANGCVVLSGSAAEFELDLPFWVFVDALDEYAAGLEPRRLESLEEPVRAELAQLFPSLSDLGGPAEFSPQDQRYRAHRAVGELIQRLAATKPLVLVLDDVHWADSASIELLGALLRRPPTAAVLLAIAARPRQLPERLAAALERADRAGALTRIELGALEREEASQLLGDGVDAPLTDALYTQSGGNPFYLEELARSIERGGALQITGSELSLEGVEVPPAVAAALTEELALLADEARRLLEGAAVTGDPFEPDLAAAAAAIDAASAMEALDELLARDLVRRTDVPRRFRFRHPLVRTVVYETAPGGWVIGAHERCALALAERGAAAAVRAHHVEHAARQGDAEALVVLREAGGAVMLRAPASAARWFGAALRVLPDNAPPEERGGLLMAFAGALAASGQLDASREQMLACLALVPDDAVSMWVTLTVACAGVEHFLGRHEEAQARLAAALERLPDPAAPEAAGLMIELAIDSLYRTDYAAMHDWAGRALEAARPLGDRPLIAAASGALMLAGAFCGEVAEAEALRPEAEAMLGAMSDDELSQRPEAGGYVAAAELYLDHFAEASAHAERALEVARATGHMSPTLVPTLGTARYMLGKLAESAALLDAGVENGRIGGIEQGLAWSLTNRAMSALAAGDADTALATAEEAHELTQRLDEQFISSWTSLAFAGALLLSGQAARAVDVLVSGAGGERVASIPGAWRVMALELLVRCRLELGARDEARAAAELAQESAATTGLPMATAWAERAAAAVALDADDARAAAEHALASAAAAEQARAVVEASLSRILAGRALAAAGDEDAAVAELERAATDLEACGALRHRDATERELRKLGRHIHRRTRRGSADATGFESLSERELEVAHLVVDRKTNREIAGELFVSLKTVEAHIRNLFRKLGVSSRVEVARAVERAERNHGPE